MFQKTFYKGFLNLLDIIEKEIKKEICNKEVNLLKMRTVILNYLTELDKKYLNILKEGGEVKDLDLEKSRKRRVWKQGALDKIRDKIPSDVFNNNISITLAQKYLEQKDIDDLTFQPEGDLKLIVRS